MTQIEALAAATLAALEARFGPRGGDDSSLLDVDARPAVIACICPACRLIQPGAWSCRCCGREQPYAAADPKVASLVARPSLLPWRRRKAGVDPAAIFDADAGTPRLTGVVGRVRATVAAHLTEQPCVASGLAIGRGPGDIVLRLVRTEPFLVVAGGEATLVVGELVLAVDERDELPPSLASQVISPTLWDTGLPTWVARLGIRAPSWDQEPLYPVFETCVREGDRVEVVGVPSTQIVPEAAGLRDAAMTVLRGQPGAPVVVRVTERR